MQLSKPEQKVSVHDLSLTPPEQLITLVRSYQTAGANMPLDIWKVIFEKVNQQKVGGLNRELIHHCKVVRPIMRDDVLLLDLEVVPPLELAGIALFQMVENGNCDGVHDLVFNAGIAINLVDTRGRTVLMHAVEKNQCTMLHYLLTCFAQYLNVSQRDYSGKSALMLAAAAENYTAVRLLSAPFAPYYPPPGVASMIYGQAPLPMPISPQMAIQSIQLSPATPVSQPAPVPPPPKKTKPTGLPLPAVAQPPSHVSPPIQPAAKNAIPPSKPLAIPAAPPKPLPPQKVPQGLTAKSSSQPGDHREKNSNNISSKPAPKKFEGAIELKKTPSPPEQKPQSSRQAIMAKLKPAPQPSTTPASSRVLTSAVTPPLNPSVAKPAKPLVAKISKYAPIKYKNHQKDARSSQKIFRVVTPAPAVEPEAVPKPAAPTPTAKTIPSPVVAPAEPPPAAPISLGPIAPKTPSLPALDSPTAVTPKAKAPPEQPVTPSAIQAPSPPKTPLAKSQKLILKQKRKQKKIKEREKLAANEANQEQHSSSNSSAPKTAEPKVSRREPAEQPHQSNEKNVIFELGRAITLLYPSTIPGYENIMAVINRFLIKYTYKTRAESVLGPAAKYFFDFEELNRDAKSIQLPLEAVLNHPQLFLFIGYLCQQMENALNQSKFLSIDKATLDNIEEFYSQLASMTNSPQLKQKSSNLTSIYKRYHAHFYSSKSAHCAATPVKEKLAKQLSVPNSSSPMPTSTRPVSSASSSGGFFPSPRPLAENAKLGDKLQEIRAQLNQILLEVTNSVTSYSNQFSRIIDSDEKAVQATLAPFFNTIIMDRKSKLDKIEVFIKELKSLNENIPSKSPHKEEVQALLKSCEDAHTKILTAQKNTLQMQLSCTLPSDSFSPS